MVPENVRRFWNEISWNHSRNFQKWVCIFPIFHAVVLLAASN